MKKLFKFTLALITWVCICFTNHTTAQVLYNYNFGGFGDFDFAYGSFAGNVVQGASYVTVGGTSTNFGGAGRVFPALDVTYTFPLVTHLTIRARLLPTHAGTDLRLTLTSSANDYSVWGVPVGLLNTTSFTTVSIPISDLPVFTSGTLDLTAVITYQLQGNYGPPASAFGVEVEFMQIEKILIPEPQSIALVAMLVLFCAVSARRYMHKPAKTIHRVSST